MKTFLLRANIRDGETEYGQMVLITAKTKPEGKKLDKLAEKWFGFGDYRIVDDAKVQEVEKDDVPILKKYGI
jgi:hypothetical protein